jgi:thiamine-phosphate pyrophosphorylase
VNAVDLRVYALLDPMQRGGRTLGELATLMAGSVTLVQLRDKTGSTRAMIEEAREIKAGLGGRAPLLVNDRVDVALVSKADGVHVGWDDMDAGDARRLLGPKAIIGLSLKSVKQAEAAPLESLDYVAIGGVFVTHSKDNPDPPVGLDGFKTILRAVRRRAPKMPVCAIAGINAGNTGGVIAAGADGVAVISALSLAPDPKQAAQDLRTLVDGTVAKRGA